MFPLVSDVIAALLELLSCIIDKILMSASDVTGENIVASFFRILAPLLLMYFIYRIMKQRKECEKTEEQSPEDEDLGNDIEISSNLFLNVFNDEAINMVVNSVPDVSIPKPPVVPDVEAAFARQRPRIVSETISQRDFLPMGAILNFNAPDQRANQEVGGSDARATQSAQGVENESSLKQSRRSNTIERCPKTGNMSEYKTANVTRSSVVIERRQYQRPPRPFVPYRNWDSVRRRYYNEDSADNFAPRMPPNLRPRHQYDCEYLPVGLNDIDSFLNTNTGNIPNDLVTQYKQSPYIVRSVPRQRQRRRLESDFMPIGMSELELVGSRTESQRSPRNIPQIRDRRVPNNCFENIEAGGIAVNRYRNACDTRDVSPSVAQSAPNVQVASTAQPPQVQNEPKLRPRRQPGSDNLPIKTHDSESVDSHKSSDAVEVSPAPSVQQVVPQRDSINQRPPTEASDSTATVQQKSEEDESVHSISYCSNICFTRIQRFAPSSDATTQTNDDQDEEI